MDFSAFNPLTSNSLNLAARRNEFLHVANLLTKLNPNCVDNRGWTCLHEAAANDSYESLMLIMKHTGCRLLAETFEGHTALYLACSQNCSIRTIKAILDNISDIVNYSSTEMISPLHLACSQERLELVELLINYGAMLNVQDFDDDTPLHDAAYRDNWDAVSLLLHAGADADIKNEVLNTPFHIACRMGSIETVMALHPFVSDINELTRHENTPLMLAAQNGKPAVVEYLLKHGANPHKKNKNDDLALNVALVHGSVKVFQLLLDVTDRDLINHDIIVTACKPHYLNMNIIKCLLESDLGPEFFNVTERLHVTFEGIGGFQPVYTKNSPLNSFFHISEYLHMQDKQEFFEVFFWVLMRGVSVNPVFPNECPPIVYLHYCPNKHCFEDVLKTMIVHGCNVDYSTNSDCKIPDVFIASLSAGGGITIPALLPYTLACEPEQLMHFAYTSGILDRISKKVQRDVLSLVDLYSEGLVAEKIPCFVLPLKHQARLAVRKTFRNNGVKSTEQFLKALDQIVLPPQLKLFLRYLCYRECPKDAALS